MLKSKGRAGWGGGGGEGLLFGRRFGKSSFDGKRERSELCEGSGLSLSASMRGDEGGGVQH